jgi:hypothetical protein
VKEFFLRQRVQTLPGEGRPFPPQELHADISPPYRFSAVVKNMWSYTSIPQWVYMAQYLVKHRDNFTFTFVVPLATGSVHIESSISYEQNVTA